MDDEDLEDMQKLFEIKCKQCGHVGATMHDSRGMGSDWTGPYGSMTIMCGNSECTNEYDISSY